MQAAEGADFNPSQRLDRLEQRSNIKATNIANKKAITSQLQGDGRRPTNRNENAFSIGQYSAPLSLESPDTGSRFKILGGCTVNKRSKKVVTLRLPHKTDEQYRSRSIREGIQRSRMLMENHQLKPQRRNTAPNLTSRSISTYTSKRTVEDRSGSSKGSKESDQIAWMSALDYNTSAGMPTESKRPKDDNQGMVEELRQENEVLKMQLTKEKQRTS